MAYSTDGTFECIAGSVKSNGGYFGLWLFEEESGSVGFVVQLLDF